MPDGWDEGDDGVEVDSAEYRRLENNAVFAIGAGILAMTSAMCAYPTYGLMALPTIPIGIAALFLGRSVQASEVQGAPRAYSNMAVATGGFAAVWGALILLFCGVLIMLYVVLIGSVFALSGSY